MGYVVHQYMAIQVLGLTLQREILLSHWLLDPSWIGLDLNGDEAY